MKALAARGLSTFASIDAAWTANYGVDGRIKNIALSRRLAARERELAIAILGFAAEDGTPATRYAATGTELRRWAEEKLRDPS